MPRAEKHEISEVHKNNRNAHSPYNQSGRKPKTRSSSWTPSIWSALTFWKSRNASQREDEEEEEEYDGDVSTDYNEVSNLLTLEDTMATTSEETRNMSPFHRPQGDHGQSNNPDSLLDSEAFVENPRKDPYVAPLPPSSPLSPSQDPLAKVTDYIDNVLRPRGGECTDVEAIGLSMLIQSSVNHSGTHHGTPPNMNPFLLPRTNSRPPSLPSLPPVQPMFTSRDTDINAILASSAPSSPSHITQVFNTSAHSTPSPSRTLAQDPNGPLYYQGGGSARSRYRSSAFGSTGRKKGPSSTPMEENSIAPKVNGMAETPSPSDGKRRRVGEERESSVAQPSGPDVSASNGTNTPPPTSAAPSSTIDFGTSTAASRFLASTPARPSPLRQSMRADSSSPGSPSSGNVNGDSPGLMISDGGGERRSNANDKASERASEIMAGIINDATKDSVSDLRNPYQPSNRTASKRTRKVPRPLPRPTRQSAEPPSEPSAQPKKLSALEIIQSTAPQAQTGSKRSHTGMPPPASPSVFINGTSTAVSQTGSNAEKSVFTDRDEDESQEPPAKKQKSEQLSVSNEDKSLEVVSSKNSAQTEEVEMTTITADNASRPNEAIELNDQTETGQQQQEMKRPIFTGPFVKAAATTRFHTAPKEPSPLRQSFQPDMPPSPPTDSSPAKKISTPPSPFSTSASTSGPSAFTVTSAPTTSAPTSLGPSPFAPTTSAPSLFGQTSALGSTSGSSIFGSTSGPSAFTQKSAASPTQTAPSPFTLSSSPGKSPFGSTSNPSAFGSTPGPSPFGSTSNPSAFGSTTGSSPFGSTSNPSAFGSATGSSPFGSTSNPSPFGSTTGPSPFGSTSNPSPFGSTTGPIAFESTSNPSPFGSTTGPTAFGSTSNPSPFGSTTGPTAFGSTSNPSPFGSTPGPTPFGSTSNPSPFGSTSGPSASAQKSGSSAFGSTSGPSAFDSNPFVQKSGPSSFTSTSTPFGSAVSTSSPFAPPKSAPSPFSISPAPAPAKDVPPAPANATAPTPTPFPSAASASLSVTADAETDWITLAKTQVLGLPTSALPIFAFPFTTNTTSPVYADQRDAALAVPTSDLPKYNFEVKPGSLPVAAFTPTPAPRAEIKSFDWAAAGMKVPTRAGWTCELCSCQNAEGSSKCNVCGKEQAPAPKGAVKAFDWAAAGIKVPSRTGWTCGLCSCQNSDGSLKCSVCGENKP